ncbi:zinc finger protein 84-like [Oppia nitens]|uniref:zinc finger protein 84-like n=1 Tax=Oppia nitens TaxID=1686743 RepID=UPI0023DBC505|nr:zinc finger protein 84-like [Oppia nitens]
MCELTNNQLNLMIKTSKHKLEKYHQSIESSFDETIDKNSMNIDINSVIVTQNCSVYLSNTTTNSQVVSTTTTDEVSDNRLFRWSIDSCCKKFTKKCQLIEHQKNCHIDFSQVSDYDNCYDTESDNVSAIIEKDKHINHIKDGNIVKKTKLALRDCQLNEVDPDKYKPNRVLVETNGNYKCTENNCTKVFATINYLKKHINVCHRDKYKCDYDGCHYKTGDKQVYKTHKINHSLEKTFKCDYNGCKTFYKNLQHLQSHKLCKHPDQYPDIQWIQCTHTGCMFRSKSSAVLINHKKRHLKLYNCDECGKRYGCSSNLKAHLTTHNSALKIKCEWPGCDRLYGVKYQLDDHMNTHTNEKTYRCDHNDCNNIVFKTVRIMRLHNLSKHPDEYPDIQWRKCSYTGCTFRSKASTLMFDHKKRHLKPYKCNECGKQFSSDKCLKSHLATHNSALKIACEWPDCERRFTTKGKLNEHMNSHTADKTYRCDWPDCDKSYHLRAGLTSHIRRTHNGKADYRCHWTGCDYQTTNSIRYRYHLQKHDGSVPVYECQAIDCNFKTKMKDAFDIHMKTKHN